MHVYNPGGNIQYLLLTGPELLGIKNPVVDIYRSAFAIPPYNEGEPEALIFAETLERHAGRDGFRSIAARAADSGHVVGFGYGYTSQPGHFWWDTVAAVLNPAEVEKWLGDCFEFVELAVLPSYQRQGIGTRLHDLLLSGLPHCTAALSTRPGTPAEKMYRKRGWVVLLDRYLFPGGTDLYSILGLDLRLRDLPYKD